MSAAGIGLVAAMNAPVRLLGEHELEVDVNGLLVSVTFNAEHVPAEPDIGVTGGWALTEIASAHLIARPSGLELDVTAWIRRLQPQIGEAIDEYLATMESER